MLLFKCLLSLSLSLHPSLPRSQPTSSVFFFFTTPTPILPPILCLPPFHCSPPFLSSPPPPHSTCQGSHSPFSSLAPIPSFGSGICLELRQGRLYRKGVSKSADFFFFFSNPPIPQPFILELPSGVPHVHFLPAAEIRPRCALHWGSPGNSGAF